VGQNLSALSINLNILRNLLPAESDAVCYDRIRDSLTLVRETFKSIRDVMADLRPPVLDDYGLAAALRWYADQFRERTVIDTTVQAEELTERLPLHIETALFRIFQEALSNIARHAHATSVVISLLELKHRFRITIRDNGVGFDPRAEYNQEEQPRWGLMGMRERAEGIGGKLKIRSEPDKGTLVVVTT
jgi:two-component system, NarL family, sensor histidine kinase UhpB